MTARIFLKTKTSHEEAERLFLGHHLDNSSYDILATGDCCIYKPDGSVLCALRKRAVSEEIQQASSEALLFLRRYKSDNRGVYAGGVRVPKDGSKTGRIVDPETGEPMVVASAIVGYFDRYPRIPFCRETAFTAGEVERWQTLLPLAQRVGDVMREAVPARWQAQMDVVARTTPEFVISGTPFTTLTVNNTVRAACHYDKGDLKQGFGCITALRTGRFHGFYLVFPEYRVAVDIENGDVLLFDPHEMHGNTAMHKVDPDAERVSVVYYYRAKMAECGTAAEERERAKMLRGALS